MKRVYLVGAGPGDPDLITVKAMKCIQQADVILYDRLVNKTLLKEAKKTCKLIFCGKLPKLHLMKQETINQFLVKYAKEGKRVVRLKGGDPYVYGRGAEEVHALALEGIPYEVVPGITAGIAAATSADIPITHRSLGRTFATVTGHCKNGIPSDIEWEHLVKSVDTLAIYMGMSNLPFIKEQLMKYGKTKQTPIAIIQEGTTENEKVVVGTLETICDDVKREEISNPAMIIVGEVVKIRAELLKLKAIDQEFKPLEVLQA